MCIVFCPNIVQIALCFVLFSHDSLSHLAIDASSCMKLMHTRTDFKLHITIETSLRNKKIISLCTFLKFHTHLKSVFDKCSRVLKCLSPLASYMKFQKSMYV